MKYSSISASLSQSTLPKSVWVFAGAILLLALWAGWAKPSEAIEVGDTAPNWMLYNTNGEAVLLYEQLPKSEKTILFFWASWCQRCSELLPTLSQLTAINPSTKTQVFTLNLWDEQDPKDHLTDLNAQLPTLAKAEAVAQRYGIAGTPALVVIDHARQVLTVKQAGEVTPEVLAHWLHPDTH